MRAHDKGANGVNDSLEDTVQVRERRARLNVKCQLLLKVAAVVDLHQGNRRSKEGSMST